MQIKKYIFTLYQLLQFEDWKFYGELFKKKLDSESELLLCEMSSLLTFAYIKVEKVVP